MNPLRKRYPDFLGERDEATVTRCVAELDDIGAALMAPARRHAAFTRVLETWSQGHQTARAPRRSLVLSPPRRVAAAVAALALLVGGAGYLRLQSPTPVSAAQVTLNRAVAAARAIPADQAAHAVYTVTTTAGTGAVPPVTLDVWVQQDGAGAIARGTFTVFTPDGHEESRTAFTHDVATTYNVQANTVVMGTVDHTGLPLPLDTTALAQLAQGAGQNARLLPPQKLDGVDVKVVELDRPVGQTGDATAASTTAPHQAVTFYIDAQTYVVRGMDFATVDAAGATQNASALRLTTYEVVPASSAPGTAFTLNAPATARILTALSRFPEGRIQHLSLAQALALPNRPVLLLAGQADGLRDVLAARAWGDTAVEYLYGQPGTRVLAVYVVTSQAGTVQPSDLLMKWPAGAGRSLTLTVAGQRIQASLYEPVATTHIVLYIHNGIGVRITGTGMSRAVFFARMRALVDGRTHRAVVRQAQRELAAASVAK